VVVRLGLQHDEAAKLPNVIRSPQLRRTQSVDIPRIYLKGLQEELGDNQSPDSRE